MTGCPTPCRAACRLCPPDTVDQGQSTSDGVLVDDPFYEFTGVLRIERDMGELSDYAAMD